MVATMVIVKILLLATFGYFFLCFLVRSMRSILDKYKSDGVVCYRGLKADRRTEPGLARFFILSGLVMHIIFWTASVFALYCFLFPF